MSTKMIQVDGALVAEDGAFASREYVASGTTDAGKVVTFTIESAKSESDAMKQARSRAILNDLTVVEA